MTGSRKPFLTATEAAKALGISLPTLYAYVSRGLVRSDVADSGKRTRRYSAEDVERLQQRQEQRRDPDRALDTVLHWGTPLLDSRLTLIADGHLYYRGREVSNLAQTSTVERVAALFWIGDEMSDHHLFTHAAVRLSERCRIVLTAVADRMPFERLQILLPVAALDDLGGYDLRPSSVAQTGGRVMKLMAAVAGNTDICDGTIAEALQRAWIPDQRDAIPLLEAALIVCADHELNVSSFTARCVASAGSTPYAVVSAGLAALQGFKHGGSCDRVEALWSEVGTPTRAGAVLAGRIRRGERIPGFGHTLYPDGDPRSDFLLKELRRIRPEAPGLAMADALIAEAQKVLGEPPNVDFALVAVSCTLNLPEGAAIALFALGRTIGWIGHAIEEYETNRLIRPRARYVGSAPEAPTGALPG